jgi:hypothetical protein
MPSLLLYPHCRSSLSPPCLRASVTPWFNSTPCFQFDSINATPHRPHSNGNVRRRWTVVRMFCFHFA